MTSRLLHRFIRIAKLVVLVVILAGLVTGWRLVRDEVSRQRVAQWILPLVQDPDDPVFTLDGLRWPELRVIEIAELHILDHEGSWLEFHDVRARIGFRGLFRQRLNVSQLSVGSATMHRTPLPGNKPIEKKPGHRPSGWSFRVNNISIDRVKLDEQIAGLVIEARAEGSLKHAIRSGGRATVSLDPVHVWGENLHARATLSWDASTFAITNLNMDSGAGSATGSLLYDHDAHRTTIEGITTNLDLTWLAGKFDLAAQGKLASRLEFSHVPGDTGITWDLAATGATYGNMAAPHARSSGTYHWKERRHIITSCRLDIPLVHIGDQSITSIIAQATSTNGAVDIEIAAAITEPLPADLHSSFTLRRDGDKLAISIPRLSGSVANQQITQDGESMIQADTNRWAVQIAPIHWNGAVFRMQAQRDHHLRSKGTLQHLNLLLIPTNLLGPVQSGQVDLDWEFGGFPERMDGEVNVRVRDIDIAEIPLRHMAPTDLRGKLRLGHDSIRVEAQTHGATNLSLMATGNINGSWSLEAPWFTPQNGMRGMALVHASLKPLCEPYLPAWQSAHGELKAVLGLSGAWQHPSITGHLVIVDGYFEDVVHGATVRNIELHAQAESRDSYRWTASARDDVRGTFSSTGTYQRIAANPFLLQAGATVSNFVFGRMFGTDIPISGQLDLQGTGVTGRLTGHVQAEPISIRLPKQLPPSIGSIRVVDIHAAPDSPAQVAPDKPRSLPVTIETDIRLGANKGVRVNGKQLRTEWRGRGQITGVIPDLRFGGSVDLTRGSFMFLGRRFTITRGEIIIPSGLRMAAPTVFVSAETRASGATITLDISGSADEPNLALSSNPPLDKNEIIARLLFGKSSDTVSPFQIAYVAYALDILEGGGSLLQQIDRSERTLGLDQIDIKQSEEESGLSAVVFGKRVMDRIYFEGEVGLQKEPDVFAVEAELTPTLILRTETSPRIREGISINWRRDY